MKKCCCRCCRCCRCGEHEQDAVKTLSADMYNDDPELLDELTSLVRDTCNAFQKASSGAWYVRDNEGTLEVFKLYSVEPVDRTVRCTNGEDVCV